MFVPSALVFSQLVKGNKDSGNEIGPGGARTRLVHACLKSNNLATLFRNDIYRLLHVKSLISFLFTSF